MLGETVAEAFVRRVLNSPDDVVAADRISGVLSYRKLYVAARLMAKRFQELQSSRHTPCAVRPSDAADGKTSALGDGMTVGADGTPTNAGVGARCLLLSYRSACYSPAR